MPRYVLINGAPRSGKDTIAKWFFNTHPKRVFFERFSMPHKLAFAAMMDQHINLWGEVDHFEDIKDEIIPTLGISFRRWQIDFSEKFMKPLSGENVFGRMLHARTRNFPPSTIVVIPDCGFQIEVDTLRDEDCLLIRVERNGCDFSSDSRSFVEPAPKWAFEQIENNGTRSDLQKSSFSLITKWLEKLDG